MNRYPDLPIGYDTRCAAEDGRRVWRTKAGTTRGHDLAAGTIYSLTITHPMLVGDEVAALLGFFEANRGEWFELEFPFDYSGSPHIYECRFGAEEPEFIPAGPVRWNARVTAVGYRS
jgi:hypothetical protein